MNHVRHNTPNGKLGVIGIDLYRRQPVCFWNQPDFIKSFFQSPHQHFAIQHGYDHFSIGRFSERSIINTSPL